MEREEVDHLHRIIIIDDNSSIHEDFRKILMNRYETDTAIKELENLLFGVEDEIEDSAAFSFEIECASQGKEGYDKVLQGQKHGQPFSLAFVDGRMPPGWDGIETIKRLWEICPDLQVVLCTAYADYSWQEIWHTLGKNDGLLILKKPFDNVEVLQMAHALTRKWELQRGFEKKLETITYYDQLTGLKNRNYFLEKGELFLEASLKKNNNGAFILIKLDKLRAINDELGLTAGDHLLQVMAERLQLIVEASDNPLDLTEASKCMLSRIDGDEFLIILSNVDQDKPAEFIVKNMVGNLMDPVVIERKTISITPSIGVAQFPDDGDTVEDLLKKVDQAMIAARNDEEKNYYFYQQIGGEVNN